MTVETTIEVFIDEVNDCYYSAYDVNYIPDDIELNDSDLILLPFLPQEINQQYIKVW